MKSILLIDGSHDNAESVERRSRAAVFHVEVAEDGIAAERVALETEFDPCCRGVPCVDPQSSD
jgi:DNA-binding response OmpR family regulator